MSYVMFIHIHLRMHVDEGAEKAETENGKETRKMEKRNTSNKRDMPSLLVLHSNSSEGFSKEMNRIERAEEQKKREN